MSEQIAGDGETNDRDMNFSAHDILWHWMIFTGVCVFAFFLLSYFGLVQHMVTSDPTYISSIIVILYVATTLHCLWRTVAIAREGEQALRTARFVANKADLPVLLASVSSPSLKGLVAGHIGDLMAKAQLQGARRLDQTLLLRVLAGRLRGSNQLGSFASDTLMKLGLLGTIVGFIMMLGPIAGLDAENQGAIKSSMALMSDGMAVAMYTTLVGLAGSVLVKIQYYMLDDATSKLFAFAVGLTEVHVISVLEGRLDHAA
jgi:biopolymer transport protein ExbB/TolQ